MKKAPVPFGSRDPSARKSIPRTRWKVKRKMWKNLPRPPWKGAGGVDPLTFRAWRARTGEAEGRAGGRTLRPFSPPEGGLGGAALLRGRPARRAGDHEGREAPCSAREAHDC